jgi:hypothetical protein
MFLPLSFGAADGFDGEARNGNANVPVIIFPFLLRFNVVGIVEHDAALFQGIDVVFVGMLVKSKQHIRVIARAQNFTRADAHLENGRAAGNRRGNRHERHDFLLAASGQAGQETANGLNAVLRIAGDANDCFRHLRYLRPSARGLGG